MFRCSTYAGLCLSPVTGWSSHQLELCGPLEYLLYLSIYLFIYLFIYLLLEYFYIFQARSQETSFSVFHYANGRLAVRLFEGKRMQCYQ